MVDITIYTDIRVVNDVFSYILKIQEMILIIRKNSKGRFAYNKNTGEWDNYPNDMALTMKDHDITNGEGITEVNVKRKHAKIIDELSIYNNFQQTSKPL